MPTSGPPRPPPPFAQPHKSQQCLSVSQSVRRFCCPRSGFCFSLHFSSSFLFLLSCSLLHAFAERVVALALPCSLTLSSSSSSRACSAWPAINSLTDTERSGESECDCVRRRRRRRRRDGRGRRRRPPSLLPRSPCDHPPLSPSLFTFVPPAALRSFVLDPLFERSFVLRFAV